MQTKGYVSLSQWLKPVLIGIALLTAACTPLIRTDNMSVVANTTEALAQFPNGTFLENGDVDKDGTLYFTSYFEKKIYAYKAGEKVRVAAELPVQPVAVLVTPQGFLLSGHAIPFTAGPSFTTSNELLELDPKGGVLRIIKTAEAKFLNGMTRLPDNSFLIADSLAATLWRYNPADQSVTPWLQHAMLGPDPSVKGFALGANGIKLFKDTLFVSNTSRQALLKVSLTGSAPGGEPTLFAKTGPIDDFTIGEDGTIYATSHAEAILRISPSGEVSEVLKNGCDACTSIFFDPTDPAKKQLIFLTTGRMLEGGKEPAKVVRLHLNQ